LSESPPLKDDDSPTSAETRCPNTPNTTPASRDQKDGADRADQLSLRPAAGSLTVMPMPRRTSVEDYFARLDDAQRPHLEELRELSREVDPEAREELKWNLPVYVRGDNTTLWMLQNFKAHCSLRFPLPFFATQREAVEQAGFEAGAGFIKLPYDRDLPTDLLRTLMQARVDEYEATGAGWNDR
jgi:uncharacterized protein YdhG (YjbR/CyaY superfamily)